MRPDPRKYVLVKPCFWAVRVLHVLDGLPEHSALGGVVAVFEARVLAPEQLRSVGRGRAAILIMLMSRSSSWAASFPSRASRTADFAPSHPTRRLPEAEVPSAKRAVMVPVCLFDETVTTCFPYFTVRQHSNENLSRETDLHIDSLTQEVPQLPSRYSPGLLTRHIE